MTKAIKHMCPAVNPNELCKKILCPHLGLHAVVEACEPDFCRHDDDGAELHCSCHRQDEDVYGDGD